MVVGVALLDELNQRFVSSRSGSIWDVLLDVGGGLFALFVYYMIRRRSVPSAPNATQ